MQSNVRRMCFPVPGGSAERRVRYGIRHESGAWYNHRAYSESNGPHVTDPARALSWESKDLAEEIAAMLSRGNRGRYEAVRLPVSAESATWADPRWGYSESQGI